MPSHSAALRAGDLLRRRAGPMGLRPTKPNEKLKDGVILSEAKGSAFSCTLDNMRGSGKKQVPRFAPSEHLVGVPECC